MGNIEIWEDEEYGVFIYYWDCPECGSPNKDLANPKEEGFDCTYCDFSHDKSVRGVPV